VEQRCGTLFQRNQRDFASNAGLVIG